ncbi:hypothetical protein A6R70_14520 [Agrobacterium rubi]|uniref:helix-turn-helix domain-containing protein n=1 Tax=Agrobacterium rubi TaxID=28099 RepID=UPI00201B8A37|nr:helix-turn-helix domain-containing protein [Agrobacterium rubi]MCL6653504.1 hypothetical protein [Agrobacterium rubi]
MNQLAPISYEDRAKARAKEIRLRLMGPQKRVNVFRRGNMASEPATAPEPQTKAIMPPLKTSLTMLMPVEEWEHPIDDVKFGPRTMREIAEEVLRNFPDVTIADIKGQSRTDRICRPRHLIVHAIKTELGKSWPEIGRFIGGKDHTTCLHSYRKIEAERARAR